MKASISVPLLITFLFVALTIINPPVIDEYIETLLVDYRFKVGNLLLPPPVPDNILIVAIDEKSLSEYGRWPWNRRLQAELIEKIFEGRPKVVAVDIFYPEPESPESDRALAEVFKKNKDHLVVALGFEVEEGKFYDGEIKDLLYDSTILKIENLRYLQSFKFKAHRVLLPPEPIAGSATFGHVYSLPDRDGKLRWETLYISYGNEYFPSLPLQTARIASGIPPDKVSIVGAIGVDLDGLLIPTDEFGRLHINYIGPERSIHYTSASDVLSNRVAPEIFRDKIVFIGASAMATYDMKITPFSANMPGVEKNATVAANIISKDFIKKSPAYLDLLVVLLTGILALFIGRKQSALYSVVLFISLTAAIVITNQAVFTYYGIRSNLVYPLFTVIMEGAFIISYRYFVEERSARNIRRIFSSYVTERVVNELIKNPDLAKLGGERREITVLFTDIRNFTAFSEKHESEEVVALLNEYLGTMTDAVFKWEGTLDKFIGDEILAFWGAPLRQDDHAELALRCALDMSERLDELQQRWKSEGRPVLDAGIGINTGEVIVGNIGAEGKKMDYTIIGDHVNLGSRVEALTKKFNTRILITEFTFNKAVNFVKAAKIGHLSIKGMGKVIVKGKELSVEIYEVKSFASGTKSRIIESEK
ncbi:MAG: adenylate/guanylate cyclase domain-containing protein [Thermodesulfovibrionia bacterium]|nr:MAG: adenylate/guanylate cyclase domain-containing protein [Thermodesulfovibrionia bacterium]